MKHKLGLKIAKILIRNSDCKVVEFLKNKAIEAQFRKVRISEKSSTHLLKLYGEIRISKRLDIPGSYMVLPNNYLWISTESCTSCRIFSRLPVIVESIYYVRSLGVITTMIIPGRLFCKRVLEDLKEADLSVETISIRDYEDHELTKRQREVLSAALRIGCLGSKRSARLKDLAFLVGVDSSTASRIIRNAIKKVVEKTLDE
ncbi:MAG: helix-turn-helix domain-containing protein [Nitrososphaerota archaeon]